MCGRFQLSVKGKDIASRYNVEVHDELHRPQKPGLPIPKGYNCSPGQWLPLILNSDPGKISYLRWGLLPPWMKDERMALKLINSRAETILEKPAFKKAFQQRRCIVPANGFYEWKKGNSKQAFRFYVAELPVFSMAGIWEKQLQPDGSMLQTFSIITVEANKSMQAIHHRMPAILSPEQENQWLESTSETEAFACLQTLPDEKLVFEPVSSLVNSVANDGPQILRKDLDTLKLF